MEDAEAAAWRSFLGGLYVNAGVAPMFAFGAMSSSFTRVIGCGDGETNLIGVAADLGLWLNIVPGMVYDRRGAKFTVICGLAMALVGYALTIDSLVEGRPWYAVAVGWFLVGHGCAWVYTSTLLFNVTNFAVGARGYAVGALQACFGLSGTVFVQLYMACVGGTLEGGVCVGGFFGGRDLVAYLSFVAVLLGAATGANLLLSSSAMRRRAADPKLSPIAGDGRALGRLSRILAQCFLICVVCVGVGVGGGSTRTWSAYALLGCFALYPPLLFLLDGPAEREDAPHPRAFSRRNTYLLPSERSAPTSTPTSLAPSGGISDDESDDLDVPFLPPPQRPDASARDAAAHWTFWFLLATAYIGPSWAFVMCSPTLVPFHRWVAFGTCVGGAITCSNNMALLARARGDCDYETLAGRGLAILTGADAFARIMGGVAITRLRCDGATVLSGGAFALFLSQALWLASPRSPDPVFLVSAGLAGVADGAAWTACPWLVAKLFGTTHYGNNFGLVCTATMIGVLVFSYGVLQRGIQAHANANDAIDCGPTSNPADLVCYGPSCFRTLHATIAAMAAIATVSAGALNLRADKSSSPARPPSPTAAAGMVGTRLA